MRRPVVPVEHEGPPAGCGRAVEILDRGQDMGQHRMGVGIAGPERDGPARRLGGRLGATGVAERQRHVEEAIDMVGAALDQSFEARDGVLGPSPPGRHDAEVMQCREIGGIGVKASREESVGFVEIAGRQGDRRIRTNAGRIVPALQV